MKLLAYAVVACFFAIIGLAEAREQLPAKAVISYGNLASIEHADGVKWNANALTEAQRIAAYRARIEDMHAMGVRVMFLGDQGGINGAPQVIRFSAFNRAARDFNTANPSAKICVVPVYVSDAVGNGTTDGVLPVFDAIDAGGTASPLCESNGKPVVGIFINGSTCVNPLTALAPRSANFSVFATQYNTANNYLSSTCKTTLSNSGGTEFKSFLYAAEKAEFATEAHMAAKKSAIEDTLSEFVPGVGTAYAKACGDGGGGKVSNDYVLTDFKFFQQLIEGFRLSISKNANYVVISHSGPGDLGSGSYITRSLVCDGNDVAVHNADSSGINHGFTCPTVPTEFQAVLPSGFRNSFSLPMFTRPGFWRVGKLFTDWFLTGVEPGTDKPFIGFAYRQHKWGLARQWGVCPDGNYVISANSVGGVYQGDNIALTSWLPAETKVRVRIGSTTLFDGTLPAKQAKLGATSSQTLVPFGNNVGKPIIEVLNQDGTVASSKVGLLEITTTPKHFGGKTGRNPGLYADYIELSQTSSGNTTTDSGSGTGILLSTTGTIKNNVVRDVVGSAIVANENADNVDVVHNTVVDSGVGISISSTAGGSNGNSMVVANNIITGASTAISKSGTIGSDAVYTANLFHNNAVNMVQSINSVATGTVAVDPKFISNTDLGLRSDSPARDAGVAAYNPGIDILGKNRSNPPDIGAYEYIDVGTRSPCTASALDPCEPGGASWPCSTLAKTICSAVPVLSTPTNIVVGANGGTYNLGENEDAYITGSGVITKTVNVYGGRDVHVKGLQIELDWPDSALQNTKALNLVGMNSAYVEGVLIDANDRCDGITLANMADNVPYLNIDSKFTIVNSYIANPNANRLGGACVGDCVQLQGEGRSGSADIDIQNLTCVTKAEGITVPNKQTGGGNQVRMSNVNVRSGAAGVPRYDVAPDGGIFYHFFSAADDKTLPVVLNSVYSDWPKSHRNVSPGPATGTQQYTDFSDPNKVKFKGSNIVGDIIRGVPPVGDFAPRSKVGVNYDRADFCIDSQVQRDGIAPEAVPFEQPSRVTLQSSPKKVLAHWHQFPISRSKTGPVGDWYSTYDKVRLRPLPRPARTSDGDVEWRIEDALADMRQARKSGVDAFLVNIYRTDQTNPWAWPTINYMLKAAARDNKGFKVAPNFDCSYGGDASQGTAMANQYADYLASIGETSSANLMKVGANYVAGTYWAQNCQAAHWTAFKTRMAERGMPTHLMCVFTGGGYRAAYDTACDSWSDWGERSADQALNLNWRTRYAGVPANEPIAGVISHGDTRYNEDGSAHDWSTSEQRGFGTLRNTWGEVLNNGADWAHLVTWNDIGEHSQMYPNTAGQWAFYDLNAYYIAWFKTGSQPPITKDAIYYSHRVAQMPSGTDMQLRHQPWANVVDVMAFLKAPATVQVITSSGTASQQLGAGLHNITAPLPSSGKPRIKVIRNGTEVVNVESQFTVGAMPAQHDAVYRAGGSLRTTIGAQTPAATVCATGTSDECLTTLGEPVWRVNTK